MCSLSGTSGHDACALLAHLQQANARDGRRVELCRRCVRSALAILALTLALAALAALFIVVVASAIIAASAAAAAKRRVEGRVGREAEAEPCDEEKQRLRGAVGKHRGRFELGVKKLRAPGEQKSYTARQHTMRREKRNPAKPGAKINR